MAVAASATGYLGLMIYYYRWPVQLAEAGNDQIVDPITPTPGSHLSE